jgi:hypothetical protein
LKICHLATLELDPNKGEELVYVNANLFLYFTRIFGSKETCQEEKSGKIKI